MHYLLGTRALAYLLTELARAYYQVSRGNIISETVEGRAKYYGLYKVVHGLSIATKMHDLEIEWPLREIQGHYSLNAAKMAKYSKATGNSLFESQKFSPPPLSVKIPENSRYENTAYIRCVRLKLS